MAISKAFGNYAMNGAGSGISSITSASFDSTGYTHIVIFGKHEGSTTTMTPSDNKSSTIEITGTKQSNTVSDSWGQFFVMKIGSPGSSHTATVSFAATRSYATILVWLVDADSGNVELAHATPSNAQSTGDRNDFGDSHTPDAGSLTVDAASVLFMGVAEYASTLYTPGTGWTEDFDTTGGGPNFTYGQSRSVAAGTYDPVCTSEGDMDWAACAIGLKELVTADVEEDLSGSAITSSAGTTSPVISVPL